MRDISYDKGLFLLTFIIGLAIHGSFSVLFIHIVPFSIFPILLLGLSIWCVHNLYANQSMKEGTLVLSAAFFLLGILIYSVIIRLQYPEIGSKVIPIIFIVILIFWIAIKLNIMQRYK